MRTRAESHGSPEIIPRLGALGIFDKTGQGKPNHIIVNQVSRLEGWVQAHCQIFFPGKYTPGQGIMVSVYP